MSEVNDLINQIISFRNDRDWAQFHNSKDLAIALNIEAGELLELFLWKNSDEVNPEKIKEELADVLIYAFLIAEKLNLNVKKIVEEKISQNEMKYPVEKSKGSSKKYNEL